MYLTKLITKELLERLPPLRATEETPVAEKIAQACFFLPGTNWYWYPVEYDAKNVFFGLVAGEFVELGYFTLSDLEELRDLWDVFVERDLYFKPKPLKEVITHYKDRLGANQLMS